MPSKAKAKITTDHDEIRRWAEERGAKPACVRGTGDPHDIGILRLDFPGYTGEHSLQPISWDDWFKKFDERGLELLHQETTAKGQKSNFNKLISRQTAAEVANAERTARRTSSTSTSTSKAPAQSRAAAAINVRNSRSGSNTKTARGKKITSISSKKESAKSSHPRPTRGRAA